MRHVKIQKQNVGNAGEYYIASRLSALNFIATITLGRAEKYDILALSSTGKLIKLSVKTTQIENATEFPLSVKDEGGQSEDFFYAFVKLNGFKVEPDFWIIPSNVVCPILKKSDEVWLATHGKSGAKHKESSIRILPIDVRKSQVTFYPKNWSNSVKKYYKNFDQLA